MRIDDIKHNKYILRWFNEESFQRVFYMLLSIFIFIVVLFLYIHIQEQFKKSEDLEVYEMDYTSNEHLQTVCDMKQPVLFEFVIKEFMDKINQLESDSQEVAVWDSQEYNDPILLTEKSFENLAKSDPKGRYFAKWDQDTEGDRDEFDLDSFMMPKFCAYSKYSIWMGAVNSHTFLQYHMNDRVFLYVTQGRINVKMTPWRSRKYLDIHTNYDNYDFYSTVNPFDTAPTSTATSSIKWLSFDVVPGYVLSIPAWWWYSIRFSTEDTRVAYLQYQTFGNLMAHTGDLARYYFQFHTTKKIPTRTLDLTEPTATESI